VGRTPSTEIEPRSFYSPSAIFEAVAQHLERAHVAGQRVDYLTFVPDGEPTLDAHLGESIARLKQFEIPIAVISNGSLCWREDVRDALREADWVSVKVDAVEEPLWRRINRPHRQLGMKAILDGIGQFAAQFDGKLATETMLVREINDDDAVEDVADYLAGLEPAVAFLAVPTRPPAEEWVLPASEGTINRAYQILARRLPCVEYLIGYEGDAFASTGDPERDLLAIAAVHPMREEALTRFLEQAKVGWELVQRLTSAGELKRVEFGGKSFYVRRLGMS
jgi:wyosine [tRNA(Phe)-imidazoG37] synthetase (radical SAM superfamily)